MRRISLGYNAVPADAEKKIIEVFRSGQFSPGPRVKEFEEVWAKRHGAKHAIFVNSGTDALRLSLLAMKEKYGWYDGDEIAVPALTFVATVNTIIQANLKPFFVDVGMNDYTINPWNLERRIGNEDHENIVAVMPVHLFGHSCGPDIYELAKKRGWKVLEDSCETIGNEIRGDVSCHSTYMAHHVTTGVGGFILTNDGRLMMLARSYANHGRDTLYLPGYEKHDLKEKHCEGNFKWAGREVLKSRFLFPRIGYSCRGTEFEAVLGLSQMGGIKENIQARRRVADLLLDVLGDFQELRLPKFTPEHTFMMFPIALSENSKIDKYDLCLHLEKNGIETRDMMPITNQSCYKNLINENDYSVAKWINEKGFYIPCHPGMTKEDVAWVDLVFKRYLDKTVLAA